MYIAGFEIGRQEISIALMIMFAMAAMFFIGYKYAYTKAINYANEQIEEKVNKFKIDYGIMNIKDNPDYLLGNVNISDLRGVNNEK